MNLDERTIVHNESMRRAHSPSGNPEASSCRTRSRYPAEMAAKLAELVLFVRACLKNLTEGCAASYDFHFFYLNKFILAKAV